MAHFIRSWKPGEPARQEYFTFRNGQWYPVEPQGQTVPPGSEAPNQLQFSVLSWNIDFMRPYGAARMAAALQHLQSLISRQAHPSIVMLNEMTRGDLMLIKSADWVREHYNITDASPDHWESPGYGTTMLVPRAIPIADVFRVHYERTSMQRDALCVDVALATSSSSTGSRVLRLCTTHLESLRANPPKRPAQLATAARYLRGENTSGEDNTDDKHVHVHAGILGGDLNAIEPFDATLPASHALRDAYLESGGVEGAEEGMTWGQMAGRVQRERFGLSRMDKILFCGRVRLLAFERFGMDVVMAGPEEACRELREGEGMERAWVTDHLGVRGKFVVVEEGEEGGGGGEAVVGQGKGSLASTAA